MLVYGIKTPIITGALLFFCIAASSELASATKKPTQKPRAPAIMQEEAKKICAKAYGLFYKAVVRNEQVICNI